MFYDALQSPFPDLVFTANASAAVESREIRLEGHLLDSGLLDRALDSVVEGAGSFQILEFNLGR